LGRRWKGKIDDVALWNRALDPGEIEVLYNSGLEGVSLGALLFGSASFFMDVSSEGDNLVLTWESQSGQLFNVRSETDLAAGAPNVDPLAWPIYNGHAALVATPPMNTLTIPRPADPTRYFVVEAFPAPPESVFFDDFESGQGGWTVGSDGAAGTAWELGAPASGPSAAKSPVNCFGTNLGGNYELNANVWLRSPSIDLTTAGGATLCYARFRDIETGFDFGSIRALDAATDAELAVIEATVDGVSIDWEVVKKAIPGAALGKVIKLEFRFQSDDIQNYAGWYLDDVLVTVP
jgi:hypothetical protein